MLGGDCVQFACRFHWLPNLSQETSEWRMLYGCDMIMIPLNFPQIYTSRGITLHSPLASKQFKKSFSAFNHQTIQLYFVQSLLCKKWAFFCMRATSYCCTFLSEDFIMVFWLPPQHWIPSNLKSAAFLRWSSCQCSECELTQKSYYSADVFPQYKAISSFVRLSGNSIKLAKRTSTKWTPHRFS